MFFQTHVGYLHDVFFCRSVYYFFDFVSPSIFFFLCFSFHFSRTCLLCDFCFSFSVFLLFLFLSPLFSLCFSSFVLTPLFLSLSLSTVLYRSSERHRYFPPVSQRQLTAAGRSPVPSCTTADKDPREADVRRKRPKAGQSAGSPVVADCIGRAPVLLSSIPSIR